MAVNVGSTPAWLDPIPRHDIETGQTTITASRNNEPAIIRTGNVDDGNVHLHLVHYSDGVTHNFQRLNDAFIRYAIDQPNTIPRSRQPTNAGLTRLVIVLEGELPRRFGSLDKRGVSREWVVAYPLGRR